MEKKVDKQDFAIVQNHVLIKVDILLNIYKFHLQQSILFGTSLVLLMMQLPSLNLCHEGMLLDRFGSKGYSILYVCYSHVTRIKKYAIISDFNYDIFDFIV